jgi:hypothetical protein
MIGLQPMADAAEFGCCVVRQPAEPYGAGCDQDGTDQAIFNRGNGAAVCLQPQPRHEIETKTVRAKKVVEAAKKALEKM